jgi:hypothetical protein
MTGEIEYLGFEGSATPVYNNQKITFTTPGISKMRFRLALNGVYKDFESETYSVQSLDLAPTILSLSPQRNDFRNPDDNLLVITGNGFVSPLRFYVGGREIDTTNITLATSGDYLLNIEMPELAAGWYDLVITTPQGVTSIQYEYYDDWVDVKVPSGGSASSASKMIVIKDLAGLTAERQLDIAWLAKSQITVGCKTLSETSYVVTINYCPKNPVNRGAMAELLAKTNSYTLAKPTSTTNLSDEAFIDIASLSAQRQIAIAWLAKTQITLGCSDGSKYCPASAVTRGAMAEFLFKLSGETSYKNYTPGFKDIKDLSAERIRAINWMQDRKITLGSGSPTTYKPNDPVNRGSMAQFLHRFVDRFSS